MIQDRALSERQLLIVLNGAPSTLGKIEATTTSKNNSDTGTAFNQTGNGLKGMFLEIQPDVACHFSTEATAALAVATTEDTKLEAGEKYRFFMPTDHPFLACRSVTGSVVLRVKRLK